MATKFGAKSTTEDPLAGIDLKGNPCGVTPIMVTGIMFNLTVRPSTSGDDPNARAHSPALISATGGAPARSSGACIGRPGSGCTSIWSKKFPLTASSSTRRAVEQHGLDVNRQSRPD